jgi:TRAP-type C4-dicarboxylate transport system permease large subunit
MMSDKYDPFFIGAIVIGALIRILMSTYAGAVKTFITFIVSVFLAIIFTDDFINYWELSKDSSVAVGVLIAFTGKGVLQWLINLSENPQKVVDMFMKWKGK